MEEIDLLYVGSVSNSNFTDVQYLLDIGKAPLGWLGEFTPYFLMPYEDFSTFPAGIAMYASTLNETLLRAALPKTKFILELDSNRDFLANPEIVELIKSFPQMQILAMSNFDSVEKLIMKVIEAKKGSATTSSVVEKKHQDLQSLSQLFNKSSFKEIFSILTNPQNTFPRSSEVINKINKYHEGK